MESTRLLSSSSHPIHAADGRTEPLQAPRGQLRMPAGYQASAYDREPNSVVAVNVEWEDQPAAGIERAVEVPENVQVEEQAGDGFAESWRRQYDKQLSAIGRHPDCLSRVHNPLLRNLLYFGPSVAGLGLGIAMAVMKPEDHLTQASLFLFSAIWTAGSCLHLRTDKAYADARGIELRYCCC